MLWSSGGTGNLNQWKFEKVEGTPYEVVIEGGPAGATVIRTVGDVEETALDGGFFMTTEEELDGTFHGALVEGYAVGKVSVDHGARTVNVEYKAVAGVNTDLQTEVAELNALVEAAVAGPYVNCHPQTAIEAALEVISTMEAKVWAGTAAEADVQTVKDAITTFNNAKILLQADGTYMLVNAARGNGTYVMLSKEGDVKCGTPVAGKNTQYWTLTSTDEANVYKVRNGDGTYIGGTPAAGSNNEADDWFKMTDKADAGSVEFYYRGGGYPDFRLRMNGSNDMHAKDRDGDKIVAYNGETNSASSWKLLPVQDEYKVYPVTIAGGAPATTKVLRTIGTETETARDGGFFLTSEEVLEGTLQFQKETIASFLPSGEVVVDNENHTVTATYTALTGNNEAYYNAALELNARLEVAVAGSYVSNYPSQTIIDVASAACPTMEEATAKAREGSVTDQEADALTTALSTFKSEQIVFKNDVAYMFINATEFTDKEDRVMISSGGDLKWGKKSPGKNSQVWKVVATGTENEYKVLNGDGKYVGITGSDFNMQEGLANAAPTTFSLVDVAKSAYKINIAGQISAHANGHGSNNDSGNIIAWEPSGGDAALAGNYSAWKILPVSDVYDVYNLEIRHTELASALVTYTVTGDEAETKTTSAVDGGFFMVSTGTVPGVNDFSVTLNDNSSTVDFTLIVDATTKTIHIMGEEAKTALITKAEEAEEELNAKKFGRPGSKYPTSLKEEIESAIAAAKAVTSVADVPALEAALDAAMAKLADGTTEVPIETGKMYMFVSAMDGKNENVAMFSSERADLRWDTKQAANNFYFILEPIEGGYKLRNGDGSYVHWNGSKGDNGGEDVLSMSGSENASTAVFTKIADTQTQHYIRFTDGTDGDNPYSNPMHMNNNGGENGNIVCWDAPANSASAWILDPVPGYDIYNIEITGGFDNTRIRYNNDEGNQGGNGGFLLIPSGTTLSAGQLSAVAPASLNVELTRTEIIAPADGTPGTIRATVSQTFTPTDEGYYIIRDLRYKRYPYGSSENFHEGNNVLFTKADTDQRSYFKISGNATDGYTICMAIDPTQCVYWTRKDDGVNVAIKPMAGDAGEECLWDIVPNASVGTGGWNIKPKGDEGHGWNIHDQIDNDPVGLWHGNSETNNVWEITQYDMSTFLSDYKKYLEDKLHTQQSNCLNNLFTQKLISDVSQLSTNADQNTIHEGNTQESIGLPGLLDRNRETYFHSAYQNGPQEKHWLQVALTEPVSQFCFYYYRRMGNDVNRPTEILVEGAKDENGEPGEWTELTTISNTDENKELPVDNAHELYLSKSIFKLVDGTNKYDSYQYLRFTVNHTNSCSDENVEHYPFFTMSEFEVFAIPRALPSYREVLNVVYPSLLDNIKNVNIEEAEAIIYLKTLEKKLKDALTLQTTTVVPLTRAASLEESKVYMIFNVSHQEEGNVDLRGVIKNDHGNLKWEATTLSDFHCSDINYLWQVTKQTTETGDITYQLRPYNTKLYATATSDELSDEATSIKIVNYADLDKAKRGTAHAYLNDTTIIACDTIKTAHNIWAIHNADASNGWSGSATGFSIAADVFEAFAFYEVESYDASQWEMRMKALRLLEKHTQVGWGKDVDRLEDPIFYAKDAVTKYHPSDPTYLDSYAYIISSYIAGYQEIVNTVSGIRQMPEDGKAYAFINHHAITGKHYLTQKGDASVRMELYTDIIPESAIFICRVQKGENPDGSSDRYAFVNAQGHWLTWRGNNGGANNNLGYMTSYDEEYASLYIAPVSYTGQTGPKDIDESADLFGMMAIGGKQEDGSVDVPFTVNSSNILDQPKNEWYMYYNLNYSTAFEIVDAPMPASTQVMVNVTNPLAGDNRYYVCTYSNSIATVVPAGVKAYAVTKKETTEAETIVRTTLLADEGEAIPANTGVLLASTQGGVSFYLNEMKPATSESNKGSDVIDRNMLVGTGADGVTVGNDIYAFILTNRSSEGGAKFHVLAEGEENRKIAAYRAYLNLTEDAPENLSRPVRIRFEFDTETGIGNINGTEAGNGNTAVIYDLSGRRVQTPVKGGLYIKGGVKYIHQ